MFHLDTLNVDRAALLEKETCEVKAISVGFEVSSYRFVNNAFIS